MDTNEMIALLLPPNGCFACSDTRKEIAEELARRSVDLERECADADKICAALGLTLEQSRTEGGSLNVPRIVGHIQETLTALRESHAFGVAMTDKYVAAQAPERAATASVDIAATVNRFVSWPLPRTFAPDCGISFDGRKDDQWNKNKSWPTGTNLFTVEEARAMFEHCIVAAPPAQAEPQEGDLLHTMMEWARTEEGRKQLADSYRPHLWACAKRVADPQNEAATCRHWCGDIEHCQPIASAPAQAEPQPEPPADALVEALRAGRQADADGVMVIVSRQACEEAADRIAALTAEVDEDNAEIASLCEAAERAESALAACEAREKALRELLRRALHATSANMSMDMYAEVCRAIDSAALARKEGV